MTLWLSDWRNQHDFRRERDCMGQLGFFSCDTAICKQRVCVRTVTRRVRADCRWLSCSASGHIMLVLLPKYPKPHSFASSCIHLSLPTTLPPGLLQQGIFGREAGPIPDAAEPAGPIDQRPRARQQQAPNLDESDARRNIHHVGCRFGLHLTPWASPQRPASSVKLFARRLRSCTACFVTP